MSEKVQFDTDQEAITSGFRGPGTFAERAISGQEQIPGMASWLMKKGILKTESGAKGALILIIILDFIIAALVIYFFILRQ